MNCPEPPESVDEARTGSGLSLLPIMNAMTRVELYELDRRRRLLVGRGALVAQINREKLAPRFVRRLVEGDMLGVGAEVLPKRLEGLVTGLFSLLKPVAEMSVDDLIGLHESVKDPDEPTLRTAPVEAYCPRQEPLSPNLVLRALDRFFEWVGSDGFGQMHAVEQVSIAQMRLLEIHPFHGSSQATSFVFSCRFLLAAGHLLPIPAESRQFFEALSRAYAFSTEALLDWNLRAGLRAYDEAER